MIPIKIQCGCGQKYAFDVEPAGGRVGHAVQCPVCGADGTAAANQLIAQHLATQPAAAAQLKIGAHSHPPEPPSPPQAPPGPAPARRLAAPKTGKRWLVSAIGACVIVAAAGAGFLAWGHGQESKAAPVTFPPDGLPHTLAELNAWYVEPPAEQNGATLFLQGLNALQAGGPATANLPVMGQGKLPALGAPLPAPVKAALAALVRSNRDALDHLAQGAKMEQSRYPVNLSLGWDAPFSHLPKLKRAEQLLELAAILHAEDKDGKQAAQDVLVSLALARSLETEPAVFSQVMRVNGLAIAMAAWERVLNRAAPPRESLAALAAAFEQIEAGDARGDAFNRGAAAERVNIMAALEAPQKLQQTIAAPGMDISPAQRDLITARLQKAANLKPEQQAFEKAFQQFMNGRKEAFPGRLKAEAHTDAAGQKLAIVAWLTPGFNRLAPKEATGLAQARLGMTAVALEQYRLAHGQQYPATLAALTPDYLKTPPQDPFDGQPLRYRKKDSGYLLYSIGPDLKDDSGERMNEGAGDLVFAVVTPPAR